MTMVPFPCMASKEFMRMFMKACLICCTSHRVADRFRSYSFVIVMPSQPLSEDRRWSWSRSSLMSRLEEERGLLDVVENLRENRFQAGNFFGDDFDVTSLALVEVGLLRKSLGEAADDDQRGS